MTPSDIARQYASDVVGGAIVACRYVKLACQRFLNDLDRQGDDDWPYVFDEAKADRAVKFMQLMPHTKGKWSASKSKLVFEPWQVFIEANIFGWVKKDTGKRRFREAYEEIPRKNGKSARLAARGIYLFAADGESGAEVYSGATTEKQAFEVFRPAWMMAHKLENLRNRFGIELSGNQKNPGPMFVMEDMSKFETVIGNPGDGASPHAALVDEYHEHDTDALVDTMQTGMGAREQPLLSIITTAGSNLGGPCYEKRRDVIRILEGQTIDETIFGIIYTIDGDDPWDDPASLIKANPNYGVSVFPDFLLAQLQQAKRSASKQNAFRTKHLNQWVGARTVWMNMLAWQRQKRDFTIADMAGCRCWMALDLASKKDVAALVMLFEKAGQFYCTPRFYAPEAAAEENEKYQNFALEGHLVLTPGSMTDYAFIEADILDLAKQIDLQDSAFDDWQANYLITRLSNTSIPVVDFNQTVKNMSDPMKEVEARVIARTLWHDGNPVMTWMMGNVAAKIDAKENIYPRKENDNDPNCKIDGPVALIMAMGRALVAGVDDGDDFMNAIRNPIIA
ncbi:terminase TerL endonuclease subunit [Pseudomonas aeruginosa]|uniref:terminase large subunit n=1 Tax=Pseudomonas aeruginosa TaxID=287 RepID=UPI0005A8BED3|nr:terminase TerL endonuclease subunit [Pseudomonas aeruginosa]ELB6585467.1 terminase large subunit [Pseudomonas aeruginosa]ELC8323549.1 terminase large subunit [Pseudomonas aeruginosa]ELK4934237.1 terminase large subunit [Pseudomonas aeruginosa]ELR9157421.1 terminase large subunit [Pseudomonas aeruginosa]MBA5162996.1 terminase large subunit [Pseudomonas aeruginosa]